MVSNLTSIGRRAWLFTPWMLLVVGAIGAVIPPPCWGFHPDTQFAGFFSYYAERLSTCSGTIGDANTALIFDVVFIFGYTSLLILLLLGQRNPLDRHSHRWTWTLPVAAGIFDLAEDGMTWFSLMALPGGYAYDSALHATLVSLLASMKWVLIAGSVGVYCWHRCHRVRPTTFPTSTRQ